MKQVNKIENIRRMYTYLHMTKFNKPHLIFNRSEFIKSNSFKTPRHQHIRVKPPYGDSFLYKKNQHNNTFYSCPCGKGGPIKNYSDEKRHKSSQYHKNYIDNKANQNDCMISKLIQEINDENRIKDKLQHICERLHQQIEKNKKLQQIQNEKISQLKSNHDNYLFEHRFSFM